MYKIPIPPSIPRRGSRFSRWLNLRILTLLGWRVEGELPDLPKMVVVAAPHTSNWDFVYGMFGAVLGRGIKVSWMGKHTLFRPAYGWFMRWLGGIPIDRSAAHGVVTESIEVMKRSDRLLLVVTPEGTRKKVARWKTGFYHIATGAGVPMLLAAPCFKRKAIVLGPLFTPTGDMERDILELQRHFRQFQARHPDQA